MLMLRLLVIGSAAGIALCVAAYLIGGDRKYLRWAWFGLRLALAAALVFFAVLIFDRLV
jgi:hypothetical protein